MVVCRISLLDGTTFEPKGIDVSQTQLISLFFSFAFQKEKQSGYHVCYKLCNYHISRLVTKPKKWPVRPAKTQISLGIHPVWSDPSLCARWVAKDPISLHADSEDWSDWADAQADLSLRWSHMPICWFCHEVAYIVFVLWIYIFTCIWRYKICFNLYFLTW